MKLVISKKSLKSLAKKGEPKATARKAPSKKITTKKQTVKAKTTSKAVKAKPVKTNKAEAKTNRSSASENIPLVQAVRSFLGLPIPKAEVPAVGEVIRCRLTSAKVEGLAVTLDGGRKGLVRASSLGKTVAEREEYIKKRLVPGQELSCSVVGISGNGRVNLDLAKGEVEAGDSLKPDFTILDGANLIGYLTNDVQRGAAFPAFADAVILRGSWPIIFFRTTMLAWLRKAAPEAHAKIESWCAANQDKCVRIDAATSDDLELLQFLVNHPNAVCVTRDRFAEYRDRYASVMGRVYPFTAILSIPGVRPTVRIPRLGLTFDLDTGSKSEVGRPKAIEVLSDRGVSLMLQRPVSSEILEHMDGAFVHSFVNDFRGTSWDCFAYASAADLPNGPEGLDVEQLDIKDYLEELKKGNAQ